jgi:hypothetical protein
MSKDIIHMSEQQLTNYFKNVFNPWYQVYVTENIIPYNHPLYYFQVETRYNYTVYQSIAFMFRIAQLREEAIDLLIITTIYMRRLITNINNTYELDFIYTKTNVTTVFFICLLLSSKYYMDDCIDNKELHQIAYYNKLTLQFFNLLEKKLLELLDYDLWVSPEEYYLYEKMINT